MKPTKFYSHSSIIKDYLRNPKRISKCCTSIEEYVRNSRADFESRYSNRRYPTRRHHILELPKEKLKVKKNCKGNPGQKNRMIAVQGCWQIDVYKLSEEGRHDFTISVAAAYDDGRVYRYSPELIQDDLCSRFGKGDYLKWKELVLSDIDSLRNLVTVVQQNINRVIPSVTCSDRSARLCEQVGIPVERGIAFLFPDRKGF